MIDSCRNLSKGIAWLLCLCTAGAIAETTKPGSLSAERQSRTTHQDEYNVDTSATPRTEPPANAAFDLDKPKELRRRQLCGPPLAKSPEGVDGTLRSASQAPVHMEAGTITGNALTGLYQLRGDASLQRLDQLLQAETLSLEEDDHRVQVSKQFMYTQAGLNLRGDSGRFDLENDTMAVDNAIFRLYPYHHGAARKLFGTGAGTLRIEDLRYSTCPPGNEFWILHGGELEFDYNSGVGIARHARLEVGGIPWVYLPYIRFPIDDSPQTGILPPSYGHSPTDGGHFTLPIYLRFAPNYDLTLYPTHYSRRGNKIGGELRYLRPELDGELKVGYMSNDEVYAEHLAAEDTQSHSAQRWKLDWQHEGKLPAEIGYGFDVKRVSDEDYLRDFSADLAGSSSTELESHAYAEQTLGNHSWHAEVQHWQNLRPQTRSDPYRRWPEISYQHIPGLLPGGFEYRLEAQAVGFELPEQANETPANQRPTGQRYHITPRLAWPIHRQAFFLEPAISLHYTHYNLDWHTPGANPGQDDRFNRTLPVVSVDAGIFLERPFSIAAQPFLQTLEPRLFYLNIPSEEQNHLPIFDTIERPDTVAQLFRENRFSGVDRIGDTNQLTTAVTTRILDLTEGTEPLRASIGQVHYFTDREVTLAQPADAQALTRSRSDLFADAELHLPGNLNVRAEHRYDPAANEPVATTFTAEWQVSPIPRSLFNLSYRVRKEVTGRNAAGEAIFARTQDYIETSGALPINVNWSVVGGWEYSRLERANLEVVAGAEYRNCCWAIRGVGKRFRHGAAAEVENSIMIELELTGLGRLGNDTQSFIEEVVRDYDEAVF